MDQTCSYMNYTLQLCLHIHLYLHMHMHLYLHLQGGPFLLSSRGDL